MNVCEICSKEYDRFRLERSVGANHWTGKFCSASCYTEFMMRDIQNTREDQYTVSCFKCGATDKLAMIPYHNKRLIGFLYACPLCQEHMIDRDARIELLNKETKQ
jgi:predicted RNA-binding Zn-ribbon protein involved in translation (DUF1610 family)